MTYEELTAKIKGGDLSGIFFFYGEERYLLDKCVAAIKKKILTPGTEAFNLFRFEGKKSTYPKSPQRWTNFRKCRR